MYNPIPFNEGFLSEEDGHTVSFAEYGNPNGQAIVSLHGGPGSKSKAKHVKCFDLEIYHVITFDQRGCGKSTPAGKIEDNTTQKLVSDMERLREHIGIESWFVTGGSWGSTLALVYAESFPERVKGLLLCAIFLADKTVSDWSFTTPNGVAMLFPDVWEERERQLALYGVNSSDSSKVLLEKLQIESIAEQKKIVATVLNWEGNLMTSSSDVSYVLAEDIKDEDIASVKVFMNYESRNFFLEKEQLLQNISKIKDIPMVIVHGRYDVLCPFEGALDLHTAHSNSKLVALPESNHKLSADGEVAKKYIFESFLKGIV